MAQLPEEDQHIIDVVESDSGLMTIGAKKQFRRYRRDAIIGYLILVVGLAANSYIDSHRNKDAREAITKSISSHEHQDIRFGVSDCRRDYQTVVALRKANIKVPLPDCSPRP